MKFQPRWLGDQTSIIPVAPTVTPPSSLQDFPSSSHQGGADCRGGSEHNDVDASTYVSGHDRC